MIAKFFGKHTILACIVLWSSLSLIAYTLSFVIRFDIASVGLIGKSWIDWWAYTAAIVVLFRLISFVIFKLYKPSLSYTSFSSVLPTIYSVVSSTIVGGAIIWIMFNGEFPRSIFVIDFVLCLLFMGIVRRFYRILTFDVEKLLIRKSIKIDDKHILEFLDNKTIVVTGAAGSIGSELCYQIVVNNTSSKLICLDHNENGLFNLEQQLSKINFNGIIIYTLCSVCRRSTVYELFQEHKPDIVFHAAAYKHVPILEKNTVSAVYNNVIGTYIMANVSNYHRVKSFILVSTDKAVSPVNVMGKTKYLSEQIIRSYVHSKKNTCTKFSIIRFGNVLGSSGSVVELFLKQIRNGNTVTITHPDMTRYFMSISEAVYLLLQAAALSNNGDILVLDMGDPINIEELARKTIKLSGLVPDIDVPIAYIGLRKGEKLHERLWSDNETADRIDDLRIFLVKIQNEKVISAHIVRGFAHVYSRNDIDHCTKQLLQTIST